ncbi:MAG: hypothetical protein Q4G04_05845 [bacterium]|nr:hypothetical protein [bacterium]
MEETFNNNCINNNGWESALKKIQHDSKNRPVGCCYPNLTGPTGPTGRTGHTGPAGVTGTSTLILGR